MSQLLSFGGVLGPVKLISHRYTACPAARVKVDLSWVATHTLDPLQA